MGRRRGADARPAGSVPATTAVRDAPPIVLARGRPVTRVYPSSRPAPTAAAGAAMDDEDRERLTLRCRRLNGAPFRRRGADYVLCWLQQALRGRANPAIDAAVALGNRLGLPVVVYHGLGRHYPHASVRLHRFILEASHDLERDVVDRGLRFLRHVERDGKLEKGLVYRLAARAGALVTDDQAAFVGRWQAETVARKADLAVIAVDANRLVPELAVGEVCRTTSAFRARVNAERERWLDERLDLEGAHAPFEGELATSHDALDGSDDEGGDRGGDGADASGPDAAIDALVRAAGVDPTLPTVRWCAGGRRAAEAHLVWAAEEIVPRYAARRNDPSVVATTHLSPWLHFGVLGPHDVMRAADAAEVDSRNLWKFGDELLVWREYFHHLAHHADDPTAYANLPPAARATLDAHRRDPRPRLYPLEALIHGETDDETWNAAERQFLADGWQHNNLRMYWGKKLIEWTASPEEAWATACYLNDRLSLDGRDPSTYGNLRWCFGAARGASEAPVYGTVARRGDGAIRRRVGDPWIREAAARPVPRVSVPERVTLEARPQASGGGRGG